MHANTITTHFIHTHACHLEWKMGRRGPACSGARCGGIHRQTQTHSPTHTPTRTHDKHQHTHTHTHTHTKDTHAHTQTHTHTHKPDLFDMASATFVACRISQKHCQSHA